MALSVTIKVERLSPDAEEALERVRDALEERVRDWLFEMLDLATEYAPADVGTLQQSLAVDGPSWDGDAVAGAIGSNLDYAVFVEFGTGPRGRAGYSEYAECYYWPEIAELGYSDLIKPKRARVLAWKVEEFAGGQKFGERMVFARFTRGQAPQPFITRAIAEVLVSEDDVAEELRRLIEGQSD